MDGGIMSLGGFEYAEYDYYVSRVLVSLESQILAIIHRVCDETKVSVKQIKSKSRKNHIVEARRIAMIHCRYETNASLEMIGEAFNRNHSTVVYHLKRK